jgi:hypothetical protein
MTDITEKFTPDVCAQLKKLAETNPTVKVLIEFLATFDDMRAELETHYIRILAQQTAAFAALVKFIPAPESE